MLTDTLKRNKEGRERERKGGEKRGGGFRGLSMKGKLVFSTCFLFDLGNLSPKHPSNKWSAIVTRPSKANHQVWPLSPPHPVEAFGSGLRFTLLPQASRSLDATSSLTHSVLTAIQSIRLQMRCQRTHYWVTADICVVLYNCFLDFSTYPKPFSRNAVCLEIESSITKI